MNKGKESVSQRSLLSNIRISSDDLLLQNRKANPKSGSRSGISPTKNGPQKESEFPLPKVIPTKVKLPNQNSSRASSADKLSGPLAGGLKMKAMLNGKVEGNANRLNDQQENRKDQESPRKDISPNRERPLRGVSKTREGQLRKEALEVVSEENEEYFRETLNGLNKASHSKSVQKMQKEPLTPIYNTKRTEFVLQELFSVKAKGTVFGREEEDVESPIKNSEKLEIETVPTFRQNEDENDNNSTTPKKQTEIEIDNNFKAPSAHVRGVFMKEHISSVQRQKEQDQKKLMKEYLDSQVNEKKRLKEEERLRKIEESKKEELRLKREVEQLNIQYEKEINHVKTRPQEVKTEPSLRETRYTVLRKEDKIENKNKEQDRESQKEMNFSSVKPARNESPKDEAFNRKTPDENPVLPLANIRKLAEENKQLRSQNDRKNELIDILLVALKNQGKEGLAASELLEADLYSGDPHSRSNSRQKLMAQSRNGENLEMGAFRKQDQMADDRSNASPWTLGSHFIRFDTDHANVGSDENFEFEETQLSAYRATETLSKLVNPGGISEIKLPLLPELYSHRKAPTFLSSSNLQQLETPNAGQPSSRFPSTPYTKVSPRQFSLNISSPSNSHATKQRSEFIPITATPKQPFSRMTHFSRSKLEDGLTVEPFNAGRLVMDTESHRISTSASQVHPKKLSDNHFLPIMQFPNFRNATANNQRIIPEIRNPIRVVDMGAHQQVQTSRSKAGYIERADNKLGRLTAEDTKDPRLNFPLKDKEPRYRRDFLSIGGDVLKNVHGIDLNNDKDYHEGELLAKRVDSLSNRNKFPKDVFCMNLRKKVNSQGA